MDCGGEVPNESGAGQVLTHSVRGVGHWATLWEDNSKNGYKNEVLCTVFLIVSRHCTSVDLIYLPREYLILAVRCIFTNVFQQRN